MKKLLTLLLVFSFAFSVSAVTSVSETKAEKFKIEKSVVKADLVSVNAVSAVIADKENPQKISLYPNRFSGSTDFINTETEFICSDKPINYTFRSKLPDKIR